MRGQWMDVHGAGAQRSDPKAGNPDDYPQGFGPQGDAIRINNYVRLVRDAVTGHIETSGKIGDFDSDGAVAFSDFLLFAKAYGSKNPEYDLNSDGDVEFQDFLVFASNFGK